MKISDKKSVLALIIALGMVGSVAMAIGKNAKDNAVAESQSVAWYVANIKQAREQNKLCHDNPELQASAPCINALHALEITFKGAN